MQIETYGRKPAMARIRAFISRVSKDVYLEMEARYKIEVY